MMSAQTRLALRAESFNAWLPAASIWLSQTLDLPPTAPGHFKTLVADG
jgi:hypothetical protein